MSFDYLWASILQVKESIVAIVGLLSSAYAIFRYGRATASKPYQARIAELIEANSTQEQEIFALKGRADRIDAVLSSKEDFWSRAPQSPFDIKRHAGEISGSIPVISVLNFKGGVGKTTICANLAGYFASIGKRVLLIDFDYQGSLSNMLLNHARIQEFAPTSHKLIEGREKPEQIRPIAERLTSLSSNLWLYPAFYEFSRHEIQVMFRWLVGKEQEIRFNLHDYLQSDLFQIESKCAFDIVLIDCPPRFLTGAVNALAASTHVLVPTILDGQSHEATLNTLHVIQKFRQNLNKNLKTLGVVPSMVVSAAGYNERELEIIEKLERQITEFHELTPVLKKHPIVRKESLAIAGGSEVLYFNSSNDQKMRDIRAMFSNLASYIEQQVNWKHTDAARIIDLRGAYDEARRIASRS